MLEKKDLLHEKMFTPLNVSLIDSGVVLHKEAATRSSWTLRHNCAYELTMFDVCPSQATQPTLPPPPPLPPTQRGNGSVRGSATGNSRRRREKRKEKGSSERGNGSENGRESGKCARESGKERMSIFVGVRKIFLNVQKTNKYIPVVQR